MLAVKEAIYSEFKPKHPITFKTGKRGYASFL